MNVSLTKKQENYIASQIKSGDFQNASELVRDALRLHQIYRHKIVEDLKKEIQSGIASGLSDATIEDIIKRNSDE